jgi:sugar/nucleoside kinase (ribokinase family)
LHAFRRSQADDFGSEADKASGAKVTYFEGYLRDPPRAKEAIRQTVRLAHAAGREVSMTLSDSFCVDRYRDEFLELMRSGTVDIVFANSHEIKSLYQTKSFDEALEAIRKDCKIAAVTRSEKGSVIVRGDETVTIQATTIRELVDTTGAGDLYAAGFLYGYTTGRSLKDCGDLGSLAAGLVIQQLGPRPRQNLRSAAQLAGLL